MPMPQPVRVFERRARRRADTAKVWSWEKRDAYRRKLMEPGPLMGAVAMTSEKGR